MKQSDDYIALKGPPDTKGKCALPNQEIVAPPCADCRGPAPFPGRYQLFEMLGDHRKIIGYLCKRCGEKAGREVINARKEKEKHD